ncbi:hypothetical protein [Planomonospora venezuelensis]|uniref:Phenylacetate-coenzyme A ligase PaaK-like adenylate-forming protein n=1 Tax=Planomonospora venezuelensis TaxID=1999 RepID=A0A841DLE9_PLAVE|nr:hypothetical protein [Planomonospora venezuelensis]MBB5967936.1 phenylacetate-coenzyme A ligase PaaK-like adenylate-forming protein [Planomonospora venezuelensis]GIN03335.1 hypothetical protein Pve01_49930 [Planomonospora venezuelensis]
MFYPENVSIGLEQPEISVFITGKFVLEVVEDSRRDRRLAVTVELAPGVTPSDKIARIAGESILTHLLRLNSEFAAYVPPHRQAPEIRLRETGDPDHFPPGAKHRYTRG